VGNFDDLAVQFDAVNKKRKGDQFELICKWFLENDPTYKPLLRKVWLWDDWPGRWDIDGGIDLIAEDHAGKLWAIQAKAFDARYSICKEDVDSFVSESSRPIISHRLLIGTTDKRARLAIKLMDDLHIPFIGLTQLREADDYLDWPATPAALRPSKPLKPKKPWPYQQAAVKDVVKGFATADRGQLIMACGTGKTLTAWFITEKLAAERTLVLVPSLSLLKQTMREWQTANPKKPFATLPVCSDETVGSLGEDAAVAHTSDLGVPVTTDPTEIAEFLRKRSGPRVVFSTYQSSPQIAKAFTEGRVPAFDLVIADEAHRVAGPVSSDFATVLDAEAIKAKRRLFMTATPRFFTGKVLRAAKEVDYEVASMDDHTKFGEVFHRLTFGEAIALRELTDYQVAIIGVDNATYLDELERGTLVTLDGKRIDDIRSVAGQIGLAKAIKKFDLHRVISFHSRVKAAKEFAASMKLVVNWMPARQRPKGELWSEHASGEMSAGDRDVLLQHLKRLDDGERGLLANARCLSEGVDVPALDGVAFIDPRRSEVDIVQAVGRAIRKSDTKIIGTIVIPVFIDADEDAEVALDSSVFKPVWDVIKALRAHDTELGEQLDELRREMGRKGGKPKLPGKIHVDVPASVSKDFAAAFEARLVDATTAPWEFWYGLLESYVLVNDTASIPKADLFEGYRLGSWASQQRINRNKRNLSPEREERLDALKGWSWAPVDEAWEAAYQKLLEYLERSGNATVERSYRDDDNYPLGEWAKTQRLNRNKGKLSPEREERLDALKGWSWAPVDEAWEAAYQKLLEYLERSGNATVERSYRDDDNYPLGEWAKTQRDFRRKGKLSPEREERLDALKGWSWAPHDTAWEENYRRLQAYVMENGSALVRGDKALRAWTKKQRDARRQGRLSEEKEERLGGLDGWSWEPLDEAWEDAYKQLLDFIKDNGHSRVPRDGSYLGTWVKKQRDARRRGTLRSERELRLDELAEWIWDLPNR
jgi:superfamily II DNA or RNA helicase